MVRKSGKFMLLVFCVILLLAMAACTSKSNNSAGSSGASGESTAPGGSASASGDSAAADLPEVNLVWYYPQPGAQSDLKLVNEEVNKITKAKINATVELKPIDFGNYEEKMNTIVAANEDFDIIWTSNWLFNWIDNQRKGAFIPLDDLLANQGKQLYDSIPEKFWNDVKLDGKIYGVPSYQIAAKRPGLEIQKTLADKYGLDVNSLKKVEDIEPFLQEIKDNEPDLTPFGTSKGWFDPIYYGFDPVVTVRRGDPTNTIVDTAFSPEYEQYLNMMHSWYTKGYINKDAATIDSIDGTDNAKYAVMWDWTLKPGGEAELSEEAGVPFIYAPLSEAFFTGSSSTINAISRTSKNPERAMMFLQLLNTDKDLYNLLDWGIEGKHYTKVSDNVIKPIPNSGYMPNTDWVFGNITNGYLTEDAPADKYEVTKQVNDSAIVSPYYGFSVNPDPIKTELANAEAVNEEYAAGLNSGTLDPAKYLPEYQKKLKQSGSEKVLAESQRQLNEWLAANGK